MMLPREVRRQKLQDRILLEMGMSAFAVYRVSIIDENSNITLVKMFASIVKDILTFYRGCRASSDTDEIITSTGCRYWKESFRRWACERRHYRHTKDAKYFRISYLC